MFFFLRFLFLLQVVGTKNHKHIYIYIPNGGEDVKICDLPG